MFYLETFPKRAVVVGGGYIAVEFAGIFQGLGASATVVNRGDMILRGFDDDIRRFAAEEMAKKGIEFRYGITVKEITKLDSGELKLNYPMAPSKSLIAYYMLLAEYLMLWI